MKTAIVVQLYKTNITPDEVISLDRLRHALPNYPVLLVTPPGLDTSQYRSVLGPVYKDTITFAPKFFSGIPGYNRLMIDSNFYEAFLEYDYILLHHTDVFVFGTDLGQWEEKGYDNIGGPIYEFDGTMNPKRYLCTGQGGLSLRHVKTFHNISRSFRSVYRYQDVKQNFLIYNWKGRVSRLGYYLMMMSTLGSRMNQRMNYIRQNEDVIWSQYVPKYFHEFKNATFEDGYRFAMEFNCAELMKLNNGQLPFGCHGWNKPMFRDFWKPYIQQYGYKM